MVRIDLLYVYSVQIFCLCNEKPTQSFFQNYRPEPGGLLPREALKLVGLVAKEGLCGMEVVEVSPPYDHADITSLMALRIVVDALGAMVSHGTMGKHKDIIDKPFVPF